MRTRTLGEAVSISDLECESFEILGKTIDETERNVRTAGILARSERYADIAIQDML